MRRLAFALLFLPLAASAQDVRSGEQITVERILVDARVTWASGDPILKLTPPDFKVLIDGKPATVESVDWIPETAVGREAAEDEEDAGAAPAAGPAPQLPPPSGRLMVFFFQTDFQRDQSRVRGQMHVLKYADDLIESLEEGDRVAVLSYDSHLKFRLDFSDNKDRISDAIRSAMLIDDPPRPPLVPSPSLGSRLNAEEMSRISTPESALTVVANALRPIPGPKSLILFGWGLGYLVNGRIVMGPQYAIAKHVLESARVTVFSLDTSMADYHSLEGGLQVAAADTGGFYSKTHIFPGIAMERLQKTLSGHYELEVRKPDTKVKGAHTIEVSVDKRGAVIMARTGYVDHE